MQHPKYTITLQGEESGVLGKKITMTGVAIPELTPAEPVADVVTITCRNERHARRVARIFEAFDLGDHVTVSGEVVTADRAGKLTPDQWQAIIQMILELVTKILPIIFGG